jgi:AraC-like DNA-binding protein
MLPGATAPGSLVDGAGVGAGYHRLVSVTITEALRLAAASQLLVVVGLLVRDHRRSRITAASALLVACVVCYLVLPVLMQPGAPGPLRHVARAGALAVPFAFWLAARLFFEDSFLPRPVHGLLLLGLLGARALVLPWPLAAAAIAIAVVVDALRRILAGTTSDLLLSRLRLRYVILLGTGIYALVVLIAEATVARGSRAADLLTAANDLGLFLLVGAISMMILRVEADLVRSPAKRQVAVEPPSILEKRLEQLIEEEHVYKTEGLTIGDLAARLGEQEYKVRQLINTRLGFRNFGAFLNHYRVREALKVLADPGQRHLGVAEVAYRFGYSSLGPFNRAFKEIVGQTPTEYRKAALEREILADSGTGEASSKGS